MTQNRDFGSFWPKIAKNRSKMAKNRGFWSFFDPFLKIQNFQLGFPQREFGEKMGHFYSKKPQKKVKIKEK